MAELENAKGIERGSTLSAEEMGAAAANLRFALENCPIDGGVMMEDGGTTSTDSVEAVSRKLEEARATGTIDLSVEDVVLLRAVSDYALQECPIEGGMEREDGSLVSKAELRALHEKLDALSQAMVQG